MSEEWAPPSGPPANMWASPTGQPVVSPEDQPVKKRRTTAAQRFADVPEVDAAPEGSLPNVRMAESIGVGPSIFSRYTTDPKFPKPVGRKGRTLFHNPEEVAKWHAELISTRTGKAIGGMARGVQRSNEADAKVDEVIASGKKIDETPRTTSREPRSAAERAVVDIEKATPGSRTLGTQFEDLFGF